MQTRVKAGLILLLAAGAVVIVALTLLAISTNPEHTWLPFIAPLVPLLLLWAGRRYFQMPALSPVWIIAGTIAIVGALGFLLTEQIAGLRGGGIVLTLPAEDRTPTAMIYALSGSAFVIGALLFGLATPRRPRAVFTATHISATARGWMLAVAAIPIVMVVAALGTSIISRDSYLAGGSLYGLGIQLGVATIGIVGYVVAASRGSQRFVALLLTLAYAAVFFSMGSRRMALLPIVFVIGVLMARPARAWLKFAIGGALALLLLPVPLFLRGRQEHGLLGYAEALGNYDLENVDWLTTLNNVLISYPITGTVAFDEPRIPIDVLWISLNPITGDSAGWYDVSRTLRLNAFTPYSSLGELWNYGPWVAIGVWVAFGLLAAWLDRAVGRLWQARLPFIGLAVVGLSALFVIQSLQYNLRASSRMLVYATLIAIAALIYIHLRDASRTKRAGRLQRTRRAHAAVGRPASDQARVSS